LVRRDIGAPLFLLLLALPGYLYLRRYDFYCVIRGVQHRIAHGHLVLPLPNVSKRRFDLFVFPLAPVRRIDPLLLLVLQLQSRRRSFFRSRGVVWSSHGSACWGYGRIGIGAARFRRDFTHQKALRRFVVQQEIDRRRSACGPVVDQLKRDMLSGTGGDQQIRLRWFRLDRFDIDVVRLPLAVLRFEVPRTVDPSCARYRQSMAHLTQSRVAVIPLKGVTVTPQETAMTVNVLQKHFTPSAPQWTSIVRRKASDAAILRVAERLCPKALRPIGSYRLTMILGFER
jgi:hypothetical protein